MKAKHIPTGEIFEITGSVYTRHEDGTLWIAVSYLIGEPTQTNEFPVDEETGDIYHPDYILIP